jgi:hypothetical protein
MSREYENKHLIDVSESNELPPEYQNHLDGIIEIPCYAEFMQKHEVQILDDVKDKDNH